MIDEEAKRDALGRLKRIAGQIGGIERMVDKERYCIDIVNQITAVKRALEQTALIIMKKHIETCVSEAIKKDNSRDKIDELLDTVDKFIRS
jgi:DNA-binding FrmR family transcriptional regulator